MFNATALPGGTFRSSHRRLLRGHPNLSSNSLQKYCLGRPVLGCIPNRTSRQMLWANAVARCITIATSTARSVQSSLMQRFLWPFLLLCAHWHLFECVLEVWCTLSSMVLIGSIKVKMSLADFPGRVIVEVVVMRQMERDVETVIHVLQPGPIGIVEHKFTAAEMIEAKATVRRAVENWRRNWALERNVGFPVFDKWK